MNNLNPNTITLSGRHIIEASAGTGKTYNITELYIRLLLGKKLMPKNILVMTFTKDATQEIIGRVEKKLREVLATISKELFELVIEGEKHIITKGDENYKHLKRALLEIDEAAIFTIHGFCKKVLSEQAFASGIEMDITMETDTFSTLKKMVEQYFRKHINLNKEKFELLRSLKCHTPEKFLDRDKLKNVVLSNYEILADNIDTTKEEFLLQKKDALEQIKLHPETVQLFISSKTPKEKDGLRAKEYPKVIEWLENENYLNKLDSSVKLFVSKPQAGKAQYNDVLSPLRELKDLQESLVGNASNQLIQQICLQIRKDFLKAKQQASVMDFDDLITKLNESVQHSPDLVKTLQLQYPVALIDEFQDTDAEQYEILDTIYPKLLYSPLERGADRRGVLDKELPHQSTTATSLSSLSTSTPLSNHEVEVQRGIDDNLLLMIGDPKQAIYGFRGGDIFTYLKAKESCDEQNQWSMDTNWRSTTGMIAAYNRLFYKDDLTVENAGKDIFGTGIDYQAVKPSDKADKDAIDFKDSLDAMNYFHYEVDSDDNAGSISAKLTKYVANEISSLLDRKVIQEKDIAILVESGTQAGLIQDALKEHGLTAVYLSQREQVYKSIEAQELLYLMEGLHEFDNKTALKKALSTSLLGANTEKFMNYQSDDTQVWSDEIESAKLLYLKWQTHGFMALIIEVIHIKMQLRQDNKHRVVTNVLHLAELIKIAENKYKHPNQLIKWYREQIANSENNAEAELRLESDENLIKIVTIHGSKGLEYPVVFVPFASKTNSKKFNAKDFNKYYDQESAQTVYKLGRNEEVKMLVDQEIIDESKRLLYVAITRASQRCYIGVAKYQSKKGGAKVPSDDSYKSPLAQFLDYQKDDNWASKVSTITNNSDNHSKLVDLNDSSYLVHSTPLSNQEGTDRCGVVSHEDIELPRQFATATPSDRRGIDFNLQAKTITLANDNWQMLSFSKITKDSHKSISLEKEDDELEATDEAQEVAKSKASLDFRFRAKKGADIGNLMHNVLENTDFSSGKIDDDILKAQFNRYNAVADEDYSSLKEWLEECLIAPIKLSYSPLERGADRWGVVSNKAVIPDSDSESISAKTSSHKKLNSCSLKDIPNNKTLKEPEFYFPIKNNRLYKTRLMQILSKYRKESDRYSDNAQSVEVNLDNITNYKIFGMLHGFIDLIFEYDGKYFVADYKSNYLGDKLEDYNQQAMSEKNRASFYDLQYLIYTIALDKYLQQSLDNYSYDEHFGGVYYLYLRGFKDGFGVYQARPSKAIVEELKELFGVADV